MIIVRIMHQNHPLFFTSLRLRTQPVSMESPEGVHQGPVTWPIVAVSIVFAAAFGLGLNALLD